MYLDRAATKCWNKGKKLAEECLQDTFKKKSFKKGGNIEPLKCLYTESYWARELQTREMQASPRNGRSQASSLITRLLDRVAAHFISLVIIWISCSQYGSLFFEGFFVLTASFLFLSFLTLLSSTPNND